MIDMKNDLDKYVINNQIKYWPSKHKDKLLVLTFLSTFFETNKVYSEKEVNDIIRDHHLFNDHTMLRRGLIDYKLLTRTQNGKEYIKNE